MRRALVREFAALPESHVLMTLDDRFPHEPGPWQTIPVSAGNERPRLKILAADADYTLVIAPETDRLLFDRARLIDQVGGQSLGSTPEAIATAGNKLQTFERLYRANVSTPPTRVVNPARGWPQRWRFPASTLAPILGNSQSLDNPTTRDDTDDRDDTDAEIEHPVVLKPIDGAGSLDTYRLEGESAWPDPDWQPELAIVQPWVPGTARSASVLVSGVGRPHILGFANQEIQVDRQQVSYRGSIAPVRFHEAEVEAISQAVGAIPGLRGWVGVDYVLNEHQSPVVLEINPRPTTSLVSFLSFLKPGDLARSWIGLIDGELDRFPDEIYNEIRKHYDDSKSTKITL